MVRVSKTSHPSRRWFLHHTPGPKIAAQMLEPLNIEFVGEPFAHEQVAWHRRLAEWPIVLQRLFRHTIGAAHLPRSLPDPAKRGIGAALDWEALKRMRRVR